MKVDDVSFPLLGVLVMLHITLASSLTSQLCSHTSTDKSQRLSLLCNTIWKYADQDTDGKAEDGNTPNSSDAPNIRYRRAAGSVDQRSGGGYIRFGRSAKGGPHIRFGRSTDGGPHIRFGRSTDGGHYIRFGRSANGGPHIRFGRSADGGQSSSQYLDSFGSTDKRNDGTHYMRFGREAVIDESEGQNLNSLIGESIEDNELVRNQDDKRFMRFGRAGYHQSSLDADATKRFMRFGRRLMHHGNSNSVDNEKRFMRFGRTSDVGDKRFMRFGRQPSETELNTNELEDDFDNEKRGVLDDEDDKRFMRFGRRDDDSKRFMRFGKRGMVDYSKRFDADDDKRFMRFGKKSELNLDGDKRFMRFGRSPVDKISEQV